MDRQHIVGLSVSNVKRITAVEIALDRTSGAIVISGANSAGKSSVMDAIAMAIRGKSAVPDEPIRIGADKASVVVRTEDLVVTRRFTANDSYIEVTGKDGKKLNKPQDVLEKLVSSVGFDPLRFSTLPQKEQATELLRLCGATIDLDANARKLRAAEEARRDANRDRDRLRTQLDAMPPPVGNVPENEVSIAGILEQLEGAKAIQRQLETASQSISANEKRISEARTKIESLNLEIAQAQRDIEESRVIVRDNPLQHETIANLTAQLSNVEGTNALVRKSAERKKLAGQVAEAVAVANEKEAAVQAVKDEREFALLGAKFPIDGLSIADDGAVIFNGVPLSQCATNEQIKVGVAIAASANPTLRVIFIKDGSLLDAASMQALELLAVKNDLQIWMERVEDDSPAAIQIHDGTNLGG